MAKVGQLGVEEPALRRLELQTKVSQPLQDSFQPLEYLIEGRAKHDDVVKVHQADPQVEASQTSLHQSPNVAGALVRPKGIRLNSKRPKGVVIAVFGLSRSLTPTCR